ncbi:IMP dehydrogenase [Candidatus Peribacteria bacterium]|nr:MAG: IMP dehydrogenase [Candidatus Peribacteria bacterium]
MAQLLFNKDEHPDATFNDIFLLPNNDIQKKVLKVATDEERMRIQAACRKYLQITDERQPLVENADTEIDFPAYQEYRSVLLEIAELHKIGGSFSRDDVDLKPRGGLSNTPLIVANMNNVTGKRMAEAIARVGGIAAVPQDKTDEELKSITEYMRTRHDVYETPITVTEDTKIHEFHKLLTKRSHNMAVAVDADGTLIGVLGKKDIPDGVNNDISVSAFIRRENFETQPDGIGPRAAIDYMDEKHVSYLPIVTGDKKVTGVLPLMDAAMRLRYNPNLDTRNGGLRALYTIGALNKNPIDRVKYLLDLGVYDILLDTANFDQGIVPYRNIEKVRNIAEQRGVDINLMAGNVVTRKATRDILAAGAKFVKVGVGPGAMCTTRMQTGVGRPQVSAVLECAEEANKRGGFVVADGGVTHPRDVAIDLAAGADYIMVGSLFAGTYESPSDLLGDEKNGFYKVNYGMASTRASVLRTFGQQRKTDKEIFRAIVGQRSEGISESRVYLKPNRESVALLHHDLLDGPASSSGYANALSLQEFPNEAVMGIQTTSGFQEGTAKEKF